MVLTALSWSVASGQPLDVLPVNFDHLTSEDGLSQGTGYAIEQDHQGYMWFGTQDGLNKYNGYDMTVYRPVDGASTSVSSGHIREIYEDSRGNVWIGTQGRGLNRYNRDSDSFTRFFGHEGVEPGTTPSGGAVVAILEDSEGVLWIGTQPGLNIYDRDSETFRYFHEAEGLSSDHITALHECSDGHLWIGTDNGLNRFNRGDETFSHYLHDPEDPHGITEGSVFAIYEDDRGTLWVGTETGLNRFDPDTGRFYRYRHDPDDPHSISGNIILSLHEDSRGRFWVGTENDGLNLMDRGKGDFQRIQSDAGNPNSLTQNSVWALYESRDRMLWVGTFRGGLNMLDLTESGFEHYRHRRHADNTLSNDYALSFLEDRHGTFYVGTDGGGLNIFDRNTGRFEAVKHDPEDPDNFLGSNVVLAMHEDRNGYIWIGHYGGGISKYDPLTGSAEQFRHVPEDSTSLASDHIYVIHEDSDGHMWFGTNGEGVNRYDPEEGRFIRVGPQGDGTGYVRAIHEDSRGHFWIATHGGGLRQIDRHTHEVIRHFYQGDAGLSSNEVMAIHEDRQNNLWVGTKEGDLHRLDYETYTFSSYSTSDGLPSSVINGIRDDEAGNLWLSTNNGIARFNPETERFKNFGVGSGVQGNEFLPLSHYEDREGYIYFGGTNGFNRFHPEEIAVGEEVPPVVFTDLKIFNESVPIGGGSPLAKHISQTERVVLPYDASVVTFDYVALDFSAEKDNEFAYKLEGFNDDWQYVGKGRSATYTNLRPGKYTFRVMASNRYGVWGEEGAASIEVEVVPPFWQTAWFYLLSVIMITGLVFGGYRLRVQAITRRNKLLERQVAERTSEVSERNEELQQALKELKQTRSELVDKAHKAGMADLAAGVLHNIGNVLNSVNTSVIIIQQTVRQTNVQKFKKANELLRANMEDIDRFIQDDPKGKQLLKYYLSLEEPIDNEVEELAMQSDRLTEKVKLIADIISAQQNFASAGRVTEQMPLNEFVEDTIMLQAGSLERHGITVERDYQEVDKIDVERSKLAHVLINLIKNAKESMDDLPTEQKKMRFSIFQDEQKIYLSVSDTGHGIESDKLYKVFQHGLTTKSGGKGFGLHSSVNYMTEMGGSLQVESPGPGYGSTFTIGFSRKKTGKRKLQTTCR